MRRILFKQELADRIAAGVKTETRRLQSEKPRSPWFVERCAFEAGETYGVTVARGGPIVGLIVVEAVDRVRLGAITHDGAIAEGFVDVRDFMEGWRTINGAWTPDLYVWRLTFHAEPNAL